MKTTIKCWYSHTILNSTGLDWKMFSKKYRKPFKLIPILCSWSFRYVSHVSQCYTQSLFRVAWQCLAESSTVSKDKILKTVFEWRLEVETTCFNGCLILFIMNFLMNSWKQESKKTPPLSIVYTLFGTSSNIAYISASVLFSGLNIRFCYIVLCCPYPITELQINRQ